MNEQTIKSVMATPAFIQATSKLMGQLSIGRKDAKQDLITELLIHRLTNWTDAEVLDAIESEDYSLPVMIHHGRQDAARRSWSADARQNAVAEKLKDSGLAEGAQQVDSPRVLDEAQTIVEAVFANTATRQWIESVLTSGKAETMSRYNMSPRQFSKKMADVCARLKSHQSTIDRVRAGYKRLPLIAEQTALTQLVSIVESEDYTDDTVQEWINIHPMLANDLVDDPAIKHQRKLIESFANAGNTDKYRMVNNVYKRIHMVQ
ncbi:hypothetical protein [Lacticaseibacillus suihuaensis]